MRPEFVEGSSGPLFTLSFTPRGNPAPGSWILHLPAFAEEMNKARHMVTWQARELARQGHGVMLVDLFGTGDSAGDFADADWECWKRDIEFLLLRLRESGAESITLWGLRTGALLAVDMLNDHPELVDRLCLWQPVLNGNQAMTQFLRLRLAAGMMSGGEENMAGLKQRLSDGESLEIAGYGLSSALYRQLSETAIQAVPAQKMKNVLVTWIEVTATPDKPINLQSKKLATAWQEAGCPMQVETVAGEPFWTTQELAVAPGLVERTSALLGTSTGSERSTGTGAAEKPVEGMEIPFTFECRGDRLLGLLHAAQGTSRRGVLVVVGGPQYRVGSHRAFVLLARALAGAGYPVMRFDYRGMGDSEGTYAGFESIHDDIRAAVDGFQAQSPGLQEVVIWGLCDAASAAAFYACQDARITGLVLANPWVRSEEGEAKAFLKHYYLKRLLSRAFWKKVLRGEFSVTESVNSLQDNVKKASAGTGQPAGSAAGQGSLATRMEHSLARFTGQTLLILSGNDLTAAEFKDAVKASRGFRRLLDKPRFQRIDLEPADHTFSRHEWLEQAVEGTRKWLSSF